MPTLATPRLTLVPLSRAIIKARLRNSQFELPREDRTVRFPAE